MQRLRFVQSLGKLATEGRTRSDYSIIATAGCRGLRSRVFNETGTGWMVMKVVVSFSFLILLYEATTSLSPPVAAAPSGFCSYSTRARSLPKAAACEVNQEVRKGHSNYRPVRYSALIQALRGFPILYKKADLWRPFSLSNSIMPTHNNAMSIPAGMGWPSFNQNPFQQ